MSAIMYVTKHAWPCATRRAVGAGPAGRARAGMGAISNRTIPPIIHGVLESI